MFERNRPYDKVIICTYHLSCALQYVMQSQGGGAEIKDDQTSTSNDVPSEDDDDWEREADELYQWSQQLSIDDSIPVTPG